MNEPKSEKSERLADRLVAADRLDSQSSEQLRKEIHAMFYRELTAMRRAVMLVVATVALASGIMCGYLAATEAELPPAARIALATGTLFGVAWCVVAGRMAWRGATDLKVDTQRIASMVWVFTVLMMVFFLFVGMSLEDRLLGLMMIANGLAFLIGAAVIWLTHRIERSELATRERLLQIELRLAEMAEANGE